MPVSSFASVSLICAEHTAPNLVKSLRSVVCTPALRERHEMGSIGASLDSPSVRVLTRANVFRLLSVCVQVFSYMNQCGTKADCVEDNRFQLGVPSKVCRHVCTDWCV